jgi:hypothetical protein
MKAVLSSTYFGPIQWYQKLVRYDNVFIDHGEPFRKQSFHNRCTIATANGLQTLTVPVEHTSKSSNPKPKTSNHGKWRSEHWNALCTAYGDSPFFLFYADDIRPFFEERRWTDLYDYNMDITLTLCRLLDIEPPTLLSEPIKEDFADFRQVIHPKHQQPDPDFLPRPYYQVYRQRNGFQPNLSILDLLFNMGPEAPLFL